MARAISKILFILGSYNFLAYLECVRSYAWSKGHSDPDLASVVKPHGNTQKENDAETEKSIYYDFMRFGNSSKVLNLLKQPTLELT